MAYGCVAMRIQSFSQVFLFIQWQPQSKWNSAGEGQIYNSFLSTLPPFDILTELNCSRQAPCLGRPDGLIWTNFGFFNRLHCEHVLHAHSTLMKSNHGVGLWKDQGSRQGFRIPHLIASCQIIVVILFAVQFLSNLGNYSGQYYEEGRCCFILWPPSNRIPSWGQAQGGKAHVKTWLKSFKVPGTRYCQVFQVLGTRNLSNSPATEPCHGARGAGA